MTQQNILELDLQEEAAAIAAHMNYHLQPQGITIKVELTEEYLKIVAQSSMPLDAALIVKRLRHRLPSLIVDSETIKEAIVYRQVEPVAK